MISDPIQILLVDDSPEDRKLIRSFLRTMGHITCNISESSSVDEAFQLLQERPFDLCLVDYYLRGREGSELITQCNMFGLSVPIIVMTAYPARDIDESVMLSGADDFVSKDDLTPETLERAIVHAIVRGRVKAKLSEDARLDMITSSLSRREFLIQSRFELLRCQRFKRTAGLILIDIDGLANINARFGHDAGDRVIRDVAARCRTLIRALDAVGRIGGDEIGILLPETPGSGVEIVANKLIHLYDSDPPEITGRAMNVTLSIGATLLAPQHTTIEAVMHVAERAVKTAQEHRGSSFEFVPPPVLTDREDTQSDN